MRYIPFRARYVSKHMRVRLIPHSFYIIFSEDSDFEVEKWGKVYGELKKGVQKSKKPQKVKKLDLGGGRGGAQRWASNFSLVTMAEMVRKSKKWRFGASEIVCRPVNICTMRRDCARTRFWSREAAYDLKITRFWQKACPICVRIKITIQNRSPQMVAACKLILHEIKAWRHAT